MKSRSLGTARKQFIKTEINKMLQDGMTEESKSPWQAQILIVNKE